MATRKNSPRQRDSWCPYDGGFPATKIDLGGRAGPSDGYDMGQTTASAERCDFGVSTLAANSGVKPGQTGTYGQLKGQKKAFGETEALDMDHQPSFASQVGAREAALGRTLTPAERAAIKANTPAVVSPRAVHQQTSPTYGGRNTPARIADDIADPAAAASRDRATFDEAMKNR